MGKARKIMEFNLSQAKALLEMFGGKDAAITVCEKGGELLAYHTDYPDEGSIVLGEIDEELALARRAKQRIALEKILSRDPQYKK
jgi:hypothetical protein